MRAVERHALQVAALVAIVAFALLLARLAQESEFIRMTVASYGYIGILVISIVSGFNLLIPIPAISFLPLYLESGLNLWITLGVITLGMTAADSVAYLAGRLGRSIAHVTEHERTLSFLDKWRTRHRLAPFLILFIYASLAPLPNELLVIPLGFMGYTYWRILPILLAGSAVFNVLTAFGILNLFNLFT